MPLSLAFVSLLLSPFNPKPGIFVSAASAISSVLSQLFLFLPGHECSIFPQILCTISLLASTMLSSPLLHIYYCIYFSFAQTTLPFSFHTVPSALPLWCILLLLEYMIRSSSNNVIISMGNWRRVRRSTLIFQSAAFTSRTVCLDKTVISLPDLILHYLSELYFPFHCLCGFVGQASF